MKNDLSKARGKSIERAAVTGVRARPLGVPAGKTSSRSVVTTARRAHVLELRKEGRTERQIAEVVGVAPSTVHTDLLAALREWMPTATAEEWQALMLDRLERTMAPWWALAIDPEAVVATLIEDGATVTRPATTADRAAAVGLIARLLPELRRWSGVERWLCQTSERPKPEFMSLEAVDGELAEIAELLRIQP